MGHLMCWVLSWKQEQNIGKLAGIDGVLTCLARLLQGLASPACCCRGCGQSPTIICGLALSICVFSLPTLVREGSNSSARCKEPFTLDSKRAFGPSLLTLVPPAPLRHARLLRHLPGHGVTSMLAEQSMSSSCLALPSCMLSPSLNTFPWFSTCPWRSAREHLPCTFPQTLPPLHLVLPRTELSSCVSPNNLYEHLCGWGWITLWERRLFPAVSSTVL